jgi:ATP synthase F0 subunit c
MTDDIQVWMKVAAFVGGGMAMGFGAIGAAIGEGYTASKANEAIARNPQLSGDLFKTMLVGQAIAETASIFALIIAMLLLFPSFSVISPLMIATYLAAGLCMGLGAIGSGIGSGLPTAEACIGIERQPGMKNRITTIMLAGSAIAQSPAIFALVTSLILLFIDFSGKPVSPTWAAILGAGLASGLGAIGSGIGEGLVAKSGCEGIARQPLGATRVTNVMLLGMAVTETTAIYGLLIACILIFKSFPAAESIAASMALLGAGLCMGIGAIGPGIGEGFAGQSAVKWIARNEEGTATLTRSMLVGQAVAESTGIYALVISLILIFVA